ncbi:transposable element Tcb1 transposase [Trichonephila clavipes]|nr:transposable element Tcb1 transposase [Trichonephila clavipes]
MGPVNPRVLIYMKTRLRKPSTDQSSRHRKKYTLRANWFIGTMTTQRYVHDILQSHALTLMQWLPGATFQQDKARPYTARMSQDCLRTVITVPWPARSPDLSPIEHIWDHLGRRVGHPTSLNELEARLQQIRNEMSQDIIQNLYASMPDRIASCIRARAGSIGY